ncbi:MAG: branched-chain amino acid ABC transporter permease [Nocardioidaceae bacterium]
MGRNLGFGVAALALLGGIGFPFVFTNPATTSIAVFTLLFVACASAWNLFSGFSGYIALGNAVFFGTGAYALANLTQHFHVAAGNQIFLLVPVAGLAAAVIAVPFGWLALRTRRHTFVVITIAIFFICQLLAYNLTGITNGSSGMLLPVPQWGPISYNAHFYAVALIVAVATVLASWLVRRSRFGLHLLAIKDDEDRARGLGVPTGQLKLTAFVMAGFFTGMCGAIDAYFLGSIYPPFVFDALFDVTVALMCFLGGLGSVSGPVLGALILEPMQQYFTLRYSANGAYLIAYGILFLVIIRFLPAGIVPTVAQTIRTWQRRRVERVTNKSERSATPVETTSAGRS